MLGAAARVLEYTSHSACLLCEVLHRPMPVHTNIAWLLCKYWQQTLAQMMAVGVENRG